MVESCTSSFSFALLGQFVGKRSSVEWEEGAIKQAWKLTIPCLVLLIETGLFIFHFGCLEDMNKTLGCHPHFIKKKKLQLARWSPSMVDLDIPKSVAVWVHLRHIPFHPWNRNNILLALASTMGKPLKFDEITASQKLLTSARVLIKVDVSKTLPSTIWMDIEGDNPNNISIDHENLPCPSCL